MQLSLEQKIKLINDKKQLIVALLFTVIVLLLFILPAYSSIPEIDYAKQPPPTEQQLKDLAIEKGLIPSDADKAYFKDELSRKNTVTTWLLLKREDKIKVVDNLKKMFKDKDNVTIKLPSAYYVDEINGVMYNSIKNGDIDETNKRGIGIMFKTIAMMDGDYDNGKNRIEELRKHVGEELFQIIKEKYPDKYEHLINLDKKK